MVKQGKGGAQDGKGRRDPITIDLKASSVRVEPTDATSPESATPEAPDTEAPNAGTPTSPAAAETGNAAPADAPATPATEGAAPETTATGTTTDAAGPRTPPAEPEPVPSAAEAPVTTEAASPAPEAHVETAATAETPKSAADPTPTASPSAAREAGAETPRAAATSPGPQPRAGLPIAAAVVGGLLGLGAAYGLAATGNWPGATAGTAGTELAAAKAEIAALDKKLADLAARPASGGTATGPAVDLAPLEKRLGDLAARVDALPKVDPAAIAANAKAIEARGGEIAALRGRLDAIEAKPEPAPSPTKTEYDAAIARLTQDLDAAQKKASADLAAARAALEEANGDIKARMGVFEADGRALSKRLLDAAATTQGEVERFVGEQKKAVERLQGRIASLEDVRATVDAALTRLAAVEAFAADIKALGTAQSQAGAKIGDLAARLDAVDAMKAEVAKSVDALKASTASAVASVGDTAKTLDAKVSGVAGRLGELEAWTKEGAKARTDAILAVSLGALRAAVDAGRPYQGEFDTATALAAGSVDLKPLAPFAATGVATPTRLASEFPAVARAVLDATDKKVIDDAGVFGSILSNATKVVRVRPEGETAGSEPPAIVARIGAKLGKGDFSGALAEWSSLPDAGKKASEAWAKALEARATADKALGTVTGAVLAKLSQPSQ